MASNFVNRSTQAHPFLLLFLCLYVSHRLRDSVPNAVSSPTPTPSRLLRQRQRPHPRPRYHQRRRHLRPCTAFGCSPTPRRLFFTLVLSHSCLLVTLVHPC